jgi:hypothetical protein
MLPREFVGVAIRRIRRQIKEPRLLRAACSGPPAQTRRQPSAGVLDAAHLGAAETQPSFPDGILRRGPSSPGTESRVTTRSAIAAFVFTSELLDDICSRRGFLVVTQNGTCARSFWRLAIWVSNRGDSLHSRHRGAAADSGPVLQGALLDIRMVKSSILERNSLRIGEVFALL